MAGYLDDLMVATLVVVTADKLVVLRDVMLVGSTDVWMVAL